MSNSLIKAHADRDLFDVSPQAFTDLRHLVDKRDFGCYKSVRGILNHLCRVKIGDDEGRTQRQVEPGNPVSRFTVRRAQDDAIRVLEIENRRTLTQKLRVGYQRERDICPLEILTNDARHHISTPNRDSAFIDDNYIM